jgi:uncharacterized protein YndB with AHSA1/START domain
MIQRSILLHCPLAEAFQLFTERVSEWWPAPHRPSKDPESRMFMEPGGRFWELGRDGREIQLGRVITWTPPHRLELDFYVGTGLTHPTAVEVTFTPEDGGTRVTVHHTSTEESHEMWAVRAPVFEKSWDAVLGSLANR